MMFSFNERAHIRALLDDALHGYAPTTPKDREILATYLDGLIAHYEVWANGSAVDMRKLRDFVIGGLRPNRT